MRCLHCGSIEIHKRGFSNTGQQRFKCMSCDRWGQDTIGNTGMKVLLFDIETTPMEVFVWQLNSKSNNYISHGNIIEDWNILSWSAKWLYDSKVMSDIQTPREAKNRNDKRISQSIWNILDEADIIIAHNGDRFDIKKLNTRFFMNGLNPPSPYQSIDTLRVAKRSFAFSSNRLDYLGQIMTNKGKLETNFQLWKDCLKGDKSQLDRMLAYNEEDVRLLEEVYVQLRPWVKSHPNMGLNSSGS
ncbi:MAG: hypothetical protein HOG49_14110, partial [Candidatus Scalindua sp.]|nr:hypothetical protein [Candidatus Scalindua sp.]